MRLRGFRRPILPGKREQNDLGFGTQITEAQDRLLNKDGSFSIVRRGVSTWNLYQELVEMSWGRFFVVVILYYFAANLFFGFLFYLNGIENLEGAEPGDHWEEFLQAVFFSIQTFTTVGYGTLGPRGIIANVIASFDALTGLMFLALATGLFFAKISAPKAHILFSSKAIISPYNGGISFQFRIANTRDTQMIDTEAVVTMTWIEVIGEVKRRRFANLNLEREKIFLFPLNWNIVHPIDEKSPLFKKSLEDLKEMRAEFLVQIKGHDETFAQMVYANSSYTWEEIVVNVRFKTMYFSHPRKGTILRLDEIDEVIDV